jgi:hypothetical protein
MIHIGRFTNATTGVMRHWEQTLLDNSAIWARVVTLAIGLRLRQNEHSLFVFIHRVVTLKAFGTGVLLGCLPRSIVQIAT